MTGTGPVMAIARRIRRRVSDTIYRVGPARYYQPAYRQIATSINLQSGAFLDLGCGPGWLCVHVASSKPAVDAVGIDFSSQMVTVARNNNARWPNITVQQMDARNILFPDSSFDVVAAVQTAHHWSDKRLILAEIHRVLKPGGRLYLYEADREAVDIPEGWIERRFGWPPSRLVVNGWQRFGMNEAEWADLQVDARALGFSNHVEDRHGFYRRLVLHK